MKIVYILSGTPVSGGATKSFLGLLRQMQANGHETLVVVPDTNGIYKSLKDNGDNVVALRYYFNVRPQNKLLSKIKFAIKSILNYLSVWQLIRICRHFYPDIIHSNTSVNNIGYLTAKKLRIPHIWHIREYGDSDFGLDIIRINERLKAPLNYSIAITKDIAHHRGVLGSPHNRVIYNGISIPKETDIAQKRKPFFLYAGRIEKAKGIEDCVEAFVKFRESTESDMKLLVAGSFTPEGELIRQRINASLPEFLRSEIVWLGDRKDIYNLMAEASATIVPSYFEGFGRVMPEAMSTGCVVIGRNTGGTKEQLDNGVEITGGEIGLRFDDVDGLARSMTEVSENGQNYYKPMTERAKKTVQLLYSANTYADKVNSFYKWILEQQKKS